MSTVIINDTTPRVKYTANGSTTRFDFDFVCFQTSDLVVYVGDTKTTTGFTITHDQTTLKGYVTFDTAPASGTGITLVREMPYNQTVDFTQVALLQRDPLHNEFSRVFAMIQQINEALGRSVTVDVFSDTNPSELINEIEALYAIKDDLTTDAQNITAITTTAGSISNVNTVAGDKTNIDTVAGISSSVSTVAGISSSVSTVATNISDVNAAATHMADIQAAPGAASAAATSEANAETWAEGSDADVAALGGTHSAKGWVDNSQIWAEGTDVQVQALGGVHSSKVWAEQSTNANIDLSNLSATGEGHFQAPLVSGTNIKTLNNESLLGSGNIATGYTVVASWRSGQAFYRKYSDGFIIQGGTLGAAQDSIATFWTPFASMYNALVTGVDGSSAHTGYIFVVNNRTLTSMHVQSGAGGVTAAYMPKTWLAYGW